jgi:GT2 family glycosyltransferase
MARQEFAIDAGERLSKKGSLLGNVAGRAMHALFILPVTPCIARAIRMGHRFMQKSHLLGFLRTVVRWRLPSARATAEHFQHVIKLAAAQHGPAARDPKHKPLISFVVPVFNTKPEYLDQLLASFRSQPQELCELILSDDGSTSPKTQKWLDNHTTAPIARLVRNKQNCGIAAATNSGIACAKGRWIGLVDHDDALAPFAVAQIAKALENAPHCQFLYTDEVITNDDLRPLDYFLKPAWDQVLLSGVNYINHLSLYRRDRLVEIGGLRDGFQGSQDYDLLLRYTSGLRPEEILHLPFPAYLWRRNGKSFSVEFLETATLNARRALAESYAQGQRLAVVDQALSPDLHRVRFDLQRAEWPAVSVVIPSRDALPLISKVLEGLTKGTDYPALEIIVVDNGSEDPEVLALYERYRQGTVPFTVSINDESFNFSRSVNRGISMAKGGLVLLLNNDIEILETNWLKEMVSCFDYPETGIVGAKLLYPDRRIQHVGVIAGLGGLAGHWFVGREENFPGPLGRLRVRLSLSVVTGACMLISRTCIDEVGLFDEDVFGIAYNDVDYCLRAISRGFRVVWTPFAALIHHESASRGSDETLENIERFRRDQKNLRERHQTQDFRDRAFSPWYSTDRSDPVPIMLDELPEAR